MIRASKLIVLVLFGIAGQLAAIPAEASDRSMRCGGYLIHAGGGKDAALMYEVLKKCGEPEARQGNTWVYTQGNVQRVLTFNFQGRLQTIESRRR